MSTKTRDGAVNFDFGTHAENLDPNTLFSEDEEVLYEAVLGWSLQSQNIQCPFCWQSIEILVDPSVTHQHYTEDCFVCCRPIVLDVRVDEFSGIHIDASAGNE